MKGAASAIVTASLAISASSAWSQTSVIQQNNVSVNHEGTSVTVSGQTVTVQTSTGAGHIVGDGQPASETRPIGPVSAIRADGAFAVTVKVGSPPGLTIETDKIYCRSSRPMCRTAGWKSTPINPIRPTDA